MASLLFCIQGLYIQDGALEIIILVYINVIICREKWVAKIACLVLRKPKMYQIKSF